MRNLLLAFSALVLSNTAYAQPLSPNELIFARNIGSCIATYNKELNTQVFIKDTLEAESITMPNEVNNFYITTAKVSEIYIKFLQQKIVVMDTALHTILDSKDLKNKEELKKAILDNFNSELNMNEKPINLVIETRRCDSIWFKTLGDESNRDAEEIIKPK